MKVVITPEMQEVVARSAGFERNVRVCYEGRDPRRGYIECSDEGCPEIHHMIWRYPRSYSSWFLPDLIRLENLFEWIVPTSKMDTLWIINNLDSPTPKIEYCFGFSRGEVNDVICWHKTLPTEECLSPIDEDVGSAVFLSIYKRVEAQNARLAAIADQG